MIPMEYFIESYQSHNGQRKYKLVRNKGRSRFRLYLDGYIAGVFDRERLARKAGREHLRG